jgi:hypothetical protein
MSVLVRKSSNASCWEAAEPELADSADSSPRCLSRVIFFMRFLRWEEKPRSVL